ncbi:MULTISPECIES: ScbA/BarX family gamma-butyrolactone biosynthesis protein [unclassified Streptomyces]|uniref:ScbA/BarX family gamma-butyrolactone biosynthesis protein n=1 Tax=unclassified Streptomyces TaxID=2593676 RepID=UPI000DB97459|nr:MULTISPECIES: ScbA/BarX family gamma-butyrolactone biosynthesis protein [unclassified Streptomyces]MYT75058.1 gamma-butyrolactone biosynthesis protein [Streptomyces sp. SID8367]RAJ69356.1 A-factor biosynthesis hotdog protein [Streptomyces sp. PsTaAH-137]
MQLDVLGDASEMPSEIQRRPLSYAQPVARHLVHRAAVAEVFITDSARTGEHTFRVAAQWPRDHALYGPPAGGASDPLLFAETLRQAMVYLAHVHHDIPLTHQFLGKACTFEITDLDALRTHGAPHEVELEVTWHWTPECRAPHRFGLRVEAVLLVDGLACGSGSLHVTTMDKRLYARLRGGERPAAGPVRPVGALRRLSAVSVGRQRPGDSVVGLGRDGRWQILVDPRHAIYFDHPSDHLPMMVMLESIRQVGHAVQRTSDDSVRGRYQMVGASGTFHAFAELDAPLYVVPRRPLVAAGTQRRFDARVDLVQNDAVVAEFTATWQRTAHLVPRRASVPVQASAAEVESLLDAGAKRMSHKLRTLSDKPSRAVGAMK